MPRYKKERNAANNGCLQRFKSISHTTGAEGYRCVWVKKRAHSDCVRCEMLTVERFECRQILKNPSWVYFEPYIYNGNLYQSTHISRNAHLVMSPVDLGWTGRTRTQSIRPGREGSSETRILLVNDGGYSGIR